MLATTFDSKPRPSIVSANLHAFFDWRRARCGITFAAFDFDQAQAARAERFQVVGRTKFRNVDSGLTCGTHDGAAGFHRAWQPVNLYADGFRKLACWCAPDRFRESGSSFEVLWEVFYRTLNRERRHSAHCT